MGKKILILSNTCGGLYSFRREVFEALLKQGHSLLVVAPDGPKTYLIKELGCQFIPISFKRQGTNPLADFKQMLTYRRIIKQEKPDVVLTYTIKPNLYGGMACRLTHTPQIANITGLGVATEKPGFLRSLTTLLYRLGLKKAQKVFFQNTENMQLCKELKLVSAPSALIPGSGVNLDHFQLLPYPPGKDGYHFVFISRIQRRKGIEQYLKAAEIIKRKYPQTEFHILGSCEDKAYKDRLEKLASEGIIQYHGFVKDTRPFLADIHCTVHPSFYPEGMSNVLLESCASGRPIITTDKAGCREIVDEGRNGFIVRQQDADDLIEKIEKFILIPHEEKEQMGLYAREKVAKEFDRRVVVDAYLKEIDSIH